MKTATDRAAEAIEAAEVMFADEMGATLDWFFDGTWRVKLGDEMNGFDAEAVVASPQEAAEWFRANAVRRYPASEFAKQFPRSANDP